MTTYSLNEIDAMCKKAARGAGYPWGLAEETGRAARWLCAHGLDGADAALSLLNANDRSTDTCAITQGCYLLDRLELSIFDNPVSLSDIHSPILLTAFVGQAAKHLEQSFVLTFDTCEILISPNGISVKGPTNQTQSTLKISQTNAVTTTKIRDGIEINPTTWSALTQLAHKTYAPATEASRLKGAGAGLTDQD